MADDNMNVQQPPRPDSSLKKLDKLVGTWNVSGPDVHGQVTFEWMEGGYFLTQHVDLEQNGQKTRGIEIIGYERGWEALGQAAEDRACRDLTSHYFDNMGNTFTYTYELDNDTLTIWGGPKDSPAKFTGRFSADGNTNTGAWTWPGGGYESTMTRVKHQ